MTDSPAELWATAIPDAERNRVLRRADWRFLLPGPAPERSICFSPGPLADATRAISGSLVTIGQGEVVESCDLAMAVDPSAAILRQAGDALRPGGALYVEWSRWRGPAGIRRTLERAGFVAVTCYAPRPTAARGAEVWVPLESDGAVRHFLAEQSRRQRGPRALLQAARGALWRLGPRFRWASPVCSIALKPAAERREPAALSTQRKEPRSRGLSPELEATLLDGWQRWGLGPEPESLASLMVTRGRRSINKAVSLVFAGSDLRPVIVIKRPRVPQSVEPMENEARVLEIVHRRPGGMHGAPRPLFCRPLDGVLTLGETFLAGRPVAELIRPANARAHALDATDWSADLAGRSTPLPAESWRARLIHPVVARFEENFGPAIDRGLVREARALLDSLGPLPLVCEQRDFSPWNLLRTTRGELGVLDWESAEAQGLPGLDLIYYLTFLTAYIDGSIYTGDLVGARRACLDRKSAMGALAEECLGRYLERLGLPAAPLKALAVLAWMIHAHSDYRHFQLDLGAAPRVEQLRTSRFLRLWYLELGASPKW
jgi:SAM-dependent methyltransferase